MPYDVVRPKSIFAEVIPVSELVKVMMLTVGILVLIIDVAAIVHWVEPPVPVVPPVPVLPAALPPLPAVLLVPPVLVTPPRPPFPVVPPRPVVPAALPPLPVVP